MEIERLLALPVPLRYAAVKQQLSGNGGSAQIFDNMNKLLRCQDEVIVSAALDVLPTILETQEAVLKAVSLLVGIARVATASTAQLLVSCITDTFLRASTDILTSLDPGDPFLTIAETAPHLDLLLGDGLQNVLMRLASPQASRSRTEAFLNHLQPFILRCLSSGIELSQSTTSALARAASLCPLCLPTVVSCMIVHLEAAREVHLASDVPLLLLDLLRHPEWPSGTASLKSRALLAIISLLPKHSVAGAPHRLTLAAVTLAAAPQKAADPQALRSAVMQLVPDAISASATAAEAPLLQVLSIVLQSLASDQGQQPTALLNCIKPQLIHHLSFPAPTPIQDSSRSLLRLIPIQFSQPAPAQLPNPSLAAHGALIMHTHSAAVDTSAPLRFLHALTQRASASIPPGPKQERYGSVSAALATLSIWPQPPGCSPSDADAPPSYIRCSPSSPSPPHFAPEPLLVAHVATLIQHPSLRCALAAAEALTACAYAAPDSVIPLFPFLLATAQSTLAAASAADAISATRHPASLLLPFLLLAVTAQSSYLDGPFFGVCAQLLAKGNGELMHSLGLRMLVTLWLATGRGYQRLRVALLAFETPSPEALAAGRGGGDRGGPALRRSVAAAAAAVARESPDKAADLVSVMHGALRDDDDAAAAAGVEAISAMCQQDALDLYGAWRVIVAVHPKLPEAPRLRAQWLLMLAHGALDARAHVDQFQSLLALLWGALRHSDPAARAAAAAAIAQYPLDLLEELEASQPLSELCGPRLEGASPEHLVCFEALMIRALSHEHAHRRALVATSAPPAASSQLAALQKRLSDMLPPKLLERHPGSAILRLELASLATAEVPQRAMALLQEALEAATWSATPELGSETPLSTVQASFASFINWALETSVATDTQLHAAITRLLQSKSNTTARNAPIALGALFAVTPLPPGSPAEVTEALVATLAAPGSPPPVAAGAAVGAVAVIAAQADADAASVTAATAALFRRIAADASADADAAAAELVALGELAAVYGLRHRKHHAHASELVQRVFTLTVHMLAECMPAMHDHITVVVRKLPEGWSAAVDAEMQAAVDAMVRRDPHESAACEAAAVRTLMRLLEASAPVEADLLAVLLIAVLQVARGEAAGVPRGAEAAVLAAMPRLLRTLQDSDLQGHITLVQQADLAAAPWSSPRDGCDLAVAARAKGAAAAFALQTALHALSKAQHAAQLDSEGTPEGMGAPPATTDAAAAAAASLRAEASRAVAFAEELPAALERGKKLQRSQIVAVGVAHACAALVDVALAAPDSGTAATAAVGKAALKVWESLAIVSGSGAVPATLLATCCKGVRASASQLSATASALKPLASFPAAGAMAVVAPRILVNPAPARSTLPAAPLAAAAAALARAPWIAQADWAAAVTHHVHADHACKTADELLMHACAGVELMNVVVAHGHHRGAGLATWLGTAARSASSWGALPLHIRVHAFTWLPRLLPMLPPPAQDCWLLRAEEAAMPAAPREGHGVPLISAVQLCAVCAGLAACVRDLFRHTSGTAARPERQRLQDKVLLLLQKLLGAAGVPAPWAQGSVRVVPEPSDLRWRVTCAALMHAPKACAIAARLPTQVSDGAAMLLRRACMPVDCAGDAEEEAVAAALAVWSSGRPMHAFPDPPSTPELQSWAWGSLAGAYSALPAKTLHQVLVAPDSQPDARRLPHACDPCMRWLAFGIVSRDLAVHRPAAAQLLRDVADGAPIAAAEMPGAWVAAAAACAAAVGADTVSRAPAAEAVSQLLESARESAEMIGGRRGSTAGTQEAQSGTGAGDGGARADDNDGSHSVRWKLSLVALVAWHAERARQAEVSLMDVADFTAWPAHSGGAAGRSVPPGPPWEMPLRVLDRTVSAVVAVDGAKAAAGRDKVVQALFELWRELEIKGCDACAGTLVRPLRALWQWLIPRDQALLVPYLAALV